MSYARITADAEYAPSLRTSSYRLMLDPEDICARLSDRVTKLEQIVKTIKLENKNLHLQLNDTLREQLRLSKYEVAYKVLTSILKDQPNVKLHRNVQCVVCCEDFDKKAEDMTNESPSAQQLDEKIKKLESLTNSERANIYVCSICRNAVHSKCVQEWWDAMHQHKHVCPFCKEPSLETITHTSSGSPDFADLELAEQDL